MSKALLIVDMLNDFINPKGKLFFERAQDVVDPIVTIRKACKDAGIPVIYNCDAHPEDSKEFEAWPPHCIAGTWGAQIIDELEPAPDDHIVLKDSLDFFSADKAIELINTLGVTQLIMVGTATEYCVLHAALSARERGLEVQVVEEAIAGVDMQPGDIDRSLERMRVAGVEFVTCKDLHL